MVNPRGARPCKEEGATVRVLAAADEAPWRELFWAYADFYAVPIDDRALNCTWAWLMATEGPLIGWGAMAGNRLVGFAHCRRVPESLTGTYSCFLDDLFVCQTQRGLGIGEQLLCAALAHASDMQWRPVRWITARDNASARRLYDRFAAATHWVTYEV